MRRENMMVRATPLKYVTDDSYNRRLDDGWRLEKHRALAAAYEINF